MIFASLLESATVQSGEGPCTKPNHINLFQVTASVKVMVLNRTKGVDIKSSIYNKICTSESLCIMRH